MDYKEGDALLISVEETLMARVRSALKSPLMTIAEKVVDEAVDSAISELNISLDSYRDVRMNRVLVDVLVRRVTRENENAQ